MQSQPRVHWDWRWTGPAPALSAIVLLVWSTVALDALRPWLEGRLPWSARVSFGFGALALFAICYAAANLRRCDEARSARRRTLLVLEAPAALLACGCLRETGGLSLLVVFAAQLPHSFQPRSAMTLLGAAVIVEMWLLLATLNHGEAATVGLLFAALQVFAMIMSRLTVSARLARDELLRANGELRSTQQLLEEGTRVGERLRLSRELHDVMGHKLTALKLQLRQLARQGPAEVRESAAACSGLADEILGDVRGVVGALRHRDGIDLERSLAALAESVPSRRIEVRIEPGVRVPQIDQAVALLRCAQEGLTNALRHGDAEHITISLERAEGGVVLRVEDDGRGMGTAACGNGLNGMRERLQLLEGRLDLRSGPERGLIVDAWLPQPGRPEAGA
jgi:signal transduction histidine kinase